MENKDLTAEKREAIFILKNENKTNTEIAKVLKISRSRVCYSLKNFGPTLFSTLKNQSDRRCKITKLDDEKIAMIRKRDHHLTTSEITS
jgi:DNA-binding MarR family transcriptional regulator